MTEKAGSADNEQRDKRPIKVKAPTGAVYNITESSVGAAIDKLARAYPHYDKSLLFPMDDEIDCSYCSDGQANMYDSDGNPTCKTCSKTRSGGAVTTSVRS